MRGLRLGADELTPSQALLNDPWRLRRVELYGALAEKEMPLFPGRRRD